MESRPARLSKEEARKVLEKKHTECVEKFKEKEKEKTMKKILQKCERYNIDMGKKLEETKSPNKDEDMKKARLRLQESYSSHFQNN